MTGPGTTLSRPACLVRVENARKTYRLGGQDVHALDGVSLEIEAGEFIAIMGTSGSGKSTLMNIIGGLDVVTSGTVEVLGQNLRALGASRMATLRSQHIGFVFQQFNLLPRTPAIRQVMLPLSYARRRVSDGEARARACLAAVELSDRLDHTPSQLSGGQQQRVAIARALINDPEILLADEPTGALDSRTSQEIMQLFKQLNAAGKTIIVVTHDPETARYANRVISFRDGRIVSDSGAPAKPAELVA